MSLKIKGCLHSACSGLSFSDTTGTYNDPDNLTGYGTENGVLNPSAFDTYELFLWAPGNDYYAQPTVPTAVINLLSFVLPTPDADGHYEWAITEAMVGVPIIDGVWFWELKGVNDVDEFYTQGFIPVVQTVGAVIKEKMKTWKPGCTSCKKGCTSKADLFDALDAIECGYPCSAKDTQLVIDWLVHKSKSCC